MKAEEMWRLYTKQYKIEDNKHYNAWAYGGNEKQSDELALLTLKGIKTATASAYVLYEQDGDCLPVVGEYNMILNSHNEAVCITKTTTVYVCPFHKVSEEHAYKEGEGDRSLEFWRSVHKDFFSRELAEYNLEFDEDMLVVCEEFEVVYR